MENINTKVLTALQNKDLDFDVVMREAYTLMNGVPTPNGKFNPVRVDADGKESLISGIGFSKDFTPVQNRDAFTVIGDLAELADIDLVNVGSWGNGAGDIRQVLAQMFPFDPKVGQRGNNAWQRRIEAVVDRFNDADNGKAEKMTAWNLYNAVQGSIQHGARKTAAYEGSVLMGDIAHKSTEALKIVEMVTLDGHTYEVAPEFDEVFRKMAVA